MGVRQGGVEESSGDVVPTTTATILFTDLAGSTELRGRLGEEAADRLARAHEGLLREVVVAHGGRVVKGTGDGVLAVFGAATDGVAAAVAAQRAVDRENRRSLLEARLAMRCGLSVGDVSVTDGDVHGVPVVEAQRLEGAAPSGGILCSEGVRLMARGRGGHRFEDVGALELKGLPEPVAACRVGWEPEAPAALGLAPFVGRTAERARLDTALARAREGAGGLVFVTGEPGIGKTRLIAEFTVAAERQGAVILEGGCHDGDIAPYAPWAEAVGAWVRHADTEELEGIRHLAPVLADVAPALRERLADLDSPYPLAPDEARHRLQDAVVRFLEALAEGAGGPAVLVLDDLHWAEGGTVTLLRAVARAARTLPLLVVGAYREVDLDRRHPLAQALGVLQREAEPERIALDGLGVEEVGSFLEALAAHDVPRAFVEALEAETDGNPFFLREILLHLLEEGKLTRDEDGRWTSPVGSVAELGIPQGVREVVGRRLDRLLPDAEALLQAASVFEGPFPFAVACEAAGLAADAGLDAVDEALEAGFLTAGDAPDTYAFAHALLRHTLYTELNPSRQVRLHRRVAEAVAERAEANPDPEAAALCAVHYGRSAVLPGAEAGVPYALLAARHARDTHAHEEEASALELALELLPTGDERRGAALGDLGLALASVPGRGEEAVAVCTEAAEAMAARGDEGAAADYLADAGRRLQAVEKIRRVWELGELAMRYVGERRDRTWVWLRVWQLAAREAADPDFPGVPLDTPERREVSEAARRLPVIERPRLSVIYRDRRDILAEGSDDAVALGFQAGEYRAAAPLFGQFAETLESMGAFGIALTVWAATGRVHSALGEFDAYAEAKGRADTLAPRVSEQTNHFAQYLALLCDHALTLDEQLDEVSTLVSDVESESPDNRWLTAGIRIYLATFNARLGREEPALGSLRETLPGIERGPGWALNYPVLTHMSAEVLWFLERTDHADVIERNTLHKVVGPDFRYPMTDGRHAMGRLCALQGRQDEALEWFARAREVLDEQGARPLRAVVDFDEALMFARRDAPGDAARARAALEAAVPQLEELGMTGWLRRAADLERQIS